VSTVYVSFSTIVFDRKDSSKIVLGNVSYFTNKWRYLGNGTTATDIVATDDSAINTDPE